MSRRIRLWAITGALLGASFGALPVALAELFWQGPSGVIKTAVCFSLWPASVLGGAMVGASLARLAELIDSVEASLRKRWFCNDD